MSQRGSGTYSEGFAAGWRSVLASEPPPPILATRPIPAGKTPFQTGYQHGAESAHRKKTGAKDGG